MKKEISILEIKGIKSVSPKIRRQEPDVPYFFQKRECGQGWMSGAAARPPGSQSF